MEAMKAPTGKELEGIEKHFEDPEFLRLFVDYAKEISNPQAMAEHEAYLQQIESEGQAEAVYGKGVQLFTPQPAFVVKTKDEAGAKRVYINICTCDKVDKMKHQILPGDPPRPHLQLPMLLSSQSKQGKASDGGDVVVWDLVVHPDAPAQARLSSSLLSNLCIMAIERVEQVSQTKLMRRFKLSGLAYKSIGCVTKPAVMGVRTEAGGQVVDGHLRPLSAGGQHDTLLNTTKAVARCGGRSSFSFGTKAPSKQPTKTANLLDPSQPGHVRPCGAVTPCWTLVERGQLDLISTWEDTGRMLRPPATQPKALIVRVDLPGVTSSAQVEVDVGSDGQVLDVRVPHKYWLQLKLTHPVADERGTARFNLAKQQLELILPTVPRQRPQPEEQDRVTDPALDAKQQASSVQEQQQQCYSPDSVNVMQYASPQIGSTSPCDDTETTDHAACSDNSLDCSSWAGPGRSMTDGMACQAHTVAQSSNQQQWQELHSKLDASVHAAEHHDQAEHQQPHQQQWQKPGQLEVVAEEWEKQHQVQEQSSLMAASTLQPRFVTSQLVADELD